MHKSRKPSSSENSIQCSLGSAAARGARARQAAVFKVPTPSFELFEVPASFVTTDKNGSTQNRKAFPRLTPRTTSSSTQPDFAGPCPRLKLPGCSALLFFWRSGLCRVSTSTRVDGVAYSVHLPLLLARAGLEIELLLSAGRHWSCGGRSKHPYSSLLHHPILHRSQHEKACFSVADGINGAKSGRCSSFAS